MNSSSSNSNYAFPNSNQMDTILGFNSPPLADSRNPGGATVAGSGSNLSRPRLMKMRRQTSHNPRSTTAFGIRRGEEADASLGFNPFRTSSESNFVDPGMENVPERVFTFGAGSRNNASFSFQAFERENMKNLDESMVDQLPDQINNLNIRGSGNVNPMKSQFTNKFPSNVETELQHEMHKMNLGNSGNVGWASNTHKTSVFGNNSKSYEHLSEISKPVTFVKQHDEERVNPDLISDRMGKMKVSESGEDSLKTFIFGATSKTREDVKADVISDKMQDLKVSGIGESSVFSTVSDNKFQSGTFTFTSKLDDLKAPNAEIKTPMESVKGSKLKKKKGKTRKHVSGQPRPTQNFVFGQTSVEILEGFEAYSPMDVSPYQETLADDYYYRGTSVTSDDTSQLNDHNSFSSESFIINSNLTTDEDLLFATQCLGINESDVKCEVSEAESFRSANENLEYSSDTFATAFDSELSSTATSSRQEESGTRLFKFGSKLENINKENFTFAASSSSQSQLSPDTRQHKKKHRLKTCQDSSSSTSDTKTDFFPIPINNPSIFSPKSVPILSSKDKDSFKSIKEQDSKHGSFSTFSTASASIAAEESCEKWRLRGNQAYNNGELVKAEDCYTQGLNSVSENEKSRSCLKALMLCYSNRSATRVSLGKMKEALQDCLMASTIDPNFLKVQLRAAHCYLAIGETENAKQQYTKCMQPGNDKKVIAEASEGLEKAQKVSECIKQCNDLSQRQDSHDLESALRVMNEALQISTCSDKLLQMKADTLFMLQRYEEVIQMCEQITSDEASNLIVKSYFYLGKLDDALEFIKKQENSSCIIPLSDTIRELLSYKKAGNEAYKSGKHTEAIEHYTAALSHSVESRSFASVCFCNRSAAYRGLGQITDAIADCSLAIALDPNYLKAISRRASLHEMIRDYGQVAIDLERLVSLLTTRVDEKGVINEIKQTRIWLSNVEEESRKGIPLNMYLILGTESNANASDIKKAYRKAALRHHPDKAAQSVVRSDDGDDGLWKKIAENVHKDVDRLFKMIGEAYAVLSNPLKRSQYDQDEEMRNEGRSFSRSKSSRMGTDVQNAVFTRTGSHH